MLSITEIVQRILRFVFRDKTITRRHFFLVLNFWNTVEGDVALFALFFDIVQPLLEKIPFLSHYQITWWPLFLL